MSFILRFSFLFLYILLFTKVHGNFDILEELNSKLETNGILSEKRSQTNSEITFNNNLYEIYIYEPADDVNVKYFNTLTKFFICFNCVVGEWIQDRLIKQIELVPLLYNKDFVSIHDNIMLKKLEKTPEVMRDVMKAAEESINVLLNIVNVHLDYYDSFCDTAILRSLISFYFKASFLISNGKEITTFDLKALQYILEPLHSVQRYRFLNCKIFFYHRGRHLYGLTSNEFDRDVDGFGTFVSVIKSLGIDKKNSHCEIKQMIMENKLSWRFGQIKWVTESGWVSIQEVTIILNTIFKEVDYILWYQQYLLHTILKMLYTEVLKCFKKDNRIPVETIEKLKTFIDLSSLKEITVLSPGFKECNTLLATEMYNEFSEDFKQKISGCIDSLPKIILYFRFLDDEDKRDKYRIGFENVDDSLNNHPIETLEGFIGYLLKVVTEFKCFLRLYQFLYNKYDTLSIPSKENIETIKRLEQMIENAVKYEEPEMTTEEKQELFLNREGCNYFRGLYQYCFESTIYLNISHSSKIYKEHVRKMFSFKVKSNLVKVKNALSTLFVDYFYLPQFKVLYNVLPLLELIDDPKILDNYDDTKRLISVVMVDFNAYSVQYCAPLENNFSLFTKIDFFKTGQSAGLSKMLDDSMNALKQHKLSNRSCTYVSIRTLFNEFDKEFNKFDQYNSVIYINWKGQRMNIKNIHNTIAYSVVDSSDLYVMYEMYVKFCLAAMYYELFYAYPRLQHSTDSNSKYDLRFTSWARTFLSTFNVIIENIEVFTKYQMEEEKIPTTQKLLSDHFKRIGVAVNTSQTTTIISDADVGTRIDKVVKFAESVNSNFKSNCVYGGT